LGLDEDCEHVDQLMASWQEDGGYSMDYYAKRGNELVTNQYYAEMIQERKRKRKEPKN